MIKSGYISKINEKEIVSTTPKNDSMINTLR